MLQLQYNFDNYNIPSNLNENTINVYDHYVNKKIFRRRRRKNTILIKNNDTTNNTTYNDTNNNINMFSYTTLLTKHNPVIDYLIKRRINNCVLGTSSHIAVLFPTVLNLEYCLILDGKRKGRNR
jgi:hypothetical protein